MSTLYHVGIDKEWLKREVRKYGARRVIGKDLSSPMACALIDAVPTTNVPGADCDDYDEDGCCRGHRSEVG